MCISIKTLSTIHKLKYRFYFEEYYNQSNAYRVWWSTEVCTFSGGNVLLYAVSIRTPIYPRHTRFTAGDQQRVRLPQVYG